jgi:hypothetical protein
MLAAWIALSLFAQKQVTFEDVELEKIKAYHDLKAFHEELEIDITTNGEVSILRRSTFLDGEKAHSILITPQQTKDESFSDGEKQWTIARAEKQFWEIKTDNNSKFDPKSELIKAIPNAFNFLCNWGRPVQFQPDPPPTLVSDEIVEVAKESLRRVKFMTTSPTGIITITQWFQPDKWILKQFLVEMSNNDASVTMRRTETVQDFKPSIPPTEFTFDPKLVAGYAKGDPATPPPFSFS